jgi:hypothetical protein
MPTTGCAARSQNESAKKVGVNVTRPVRDFSAAATERRSVLAATRTSASTNRK